ncbi:3-deoxy-manno-octulosonate cytidylyltransferase [Porticoccaceae bacterium]|nr:3-deoxy-manno-octulosonate cytidylyltransferase [Porticoccaceae bacterium]
MKAIGIIPARMGASRFPGKPLAHLLGMPMVGHCYHRTCLAKGLSDVFVATCDDVIADYVKSIGGIAIMTSSEHDRASTRTAEALDIIEENLGETIDVVVMVQGDEPLITPEAISLTLKHFEDPRVNIVNIMSRINSEEAFRDHNNVKVVVNHNSDALYFSREPIPSPWKGWEQLPRYMQTGIIAFRRDSLRQFNAMNETELERYESVDMNRVLESGGTIRMVPIDGLTIGVDTPDELEQAERLLGTDDVFKAYKNI